MLAPPPSTSVLRHCLAIALVALVSTSAAPGAPPRETGSYKLEAGEYVFVMLALRCVNTPIEVVMMRDEYKALRRLREESRQARKREPAFRPDGGVESPLVACLSVTLATPPELVATEGDQVRVLMPRFERVYDDGLVSESGDPYPASGLYRSDGSVKPVWTVSWYAADVRVARYGARVVT